MRSLERAEVNNVKVLSFQSPSSVPCAVSFIDDRGRPEDDEDS